MILCSFISSNVRMVNTVTANSTDVLMTPMLKHMVDYPVKCVNLTLNAPARFATYQVSAKVKVKKTNVLLIMIAKLVFSVVLSLILVNNKKQKMRNVRPNLTV
jgi:hypothetical protein